MTSGGITEQDAFVLQRLYNVRRQSSYQAEDCKVMYMKL